MQINTVHDRCAEGLVADRLHSTPRAAVLRFPLGGSCGIPLIILSPVGIEILTWAFMGFDSQSAGDPSCVLVLGRTDGGPIAAEASLTVRAHVRDLNLTVSPSSAGASLSQSESLLLAEAVITALAPATFEPLATLLPLLGPALDALAPQPGAPLPRLDDRSDDLVVEELDFIPAFVLARTNDVYACAPVTSVRARATPRRTLRLTTDNRLGAASAIDRAILVGEGRYAVAGRMPRV